MRGFDFKNPILGPTFDGPDFEKLEMRASPKTMKYWSVDPWIRGFTPSGVLGFEIKSHFRSMCE